MHIDFNVKDHSHLSKTKKKTVALKSLPDFGQKRLPKRSKDRYTIRNFSLYSDLLNGSIKKKNQQIKPA